MLWVILSMLALAAIAALALGDSGTIGGLDGSMIAALVSSLALLIFIAGPMLFGGGRGQLSKGMRDFAVWVGLILLLVLGYAFRDDVKHIYQRMAGELLPPGHTLSVSDERSGGQAVRIRGSGGHFRARTQVNGETVTMLVDTGASSIVLTQTDARRAGIDVERLSYTIPSQTANGIAFSAATKLSSVAVGPIQMYNLDVRVSKPGALSESLLGMNFLTRLSSYEFTGDFLTLRQ